MLNYLLESVDSLALQKKIKEIIKKNNFLDATVSDYDMGEVLLERALEDLDTYSFLSNKKVVIISNIDALKQEENKKDIDHLYKYLDNSSSDNLLIITGSKLNNTLKITKELKKKCEYIKVEFNATSFVKEKLKGYTIDNNTINYLTETCLLDISKLDNECNKLKMFCLDSKNITKKDIDEIVVKKLGDSKDTTFAFTRALAEKDKSAALKLYNELLEYETDALGIVGLLASQVRIIYQVKLLEQKNLSNKEIANILGEKSDYRISKTKELTRYYSEKELLKLMESLQKIDLSVKSSDIDANFLIELFILNM